MFTGIIKHSGSFKGFRSGKKGLLIEAPSVADKISIGDSLAVNGVCLSLTGKEKGILLFDLSGETLKKTTLGSLRPKDRLNLELPVTPTTLLDC